jgi:hypothetical protein
VITRRLCDKIDHQATTINYLVGSQLEIAKTPLVLENDRQALTACMMTVGLTPYADQKIMRIKNTLELETVDVSQVYLPEIEDRSDLEIVTPARFLRIGVDGYFARFAEG